MNAMFVAVILGVVAVASATTVPAGTSVYQQPQYQPLQPGVQYQPVVQRQPVVQSEQVVGGRVVPGVYPGSVGSHVYTSGVVPSVYSSGIVRGVHPANAAPTVGGSYPYYPTA
ncbi:cuticle protein 9.5-like [Schistocerca gregaria]|uniref:cuticle protein 9.5-like n=1 Tax=Schistocerca gregaria TaxID=7010 RepID=UPI00211DB035|nr:cuticle protein 9.5-like [Schistocerca gregaria]